MGEATGRLERFLQPNRIKRRSAARAASVYGLMIAGTRCPRQFPLAFVPVMSNPS